MDIDMDIKELEAFVYVGVGADSGAGDQPMQASKSVEYDGKAVKIQL